MTARRKGRDLFDLWHVLNDMHVDDALHPDGLVHYMGTDEFGYRELSTNLAAKLEHRRGLPTDSAEVLPCGILPETLT